MDSAGENFQNSSMCIFLTLAPPCGLGKESQENEFLAEDVVSAWACVWGEMGCQALGVLWSTLPRHCDYLHILKKKIRTNFSKWWLFCFTALVCTFFRFWPGSSSPMVTHHMAQLYKWGRRICNRELGCSYKSRNRSWEIACEFWLR